MAVHPIKSHKACSGHHLYPCWRTYGMYAGSSMQGHPLQDAQPCWLLFRIPVPSHAPVCACVGVPKPERAEFCRACTHRHLNLWVSGMCTCNSQLFIRHVYMPETRSSGAGTRMHDRMLLFQVSVLLRTRKPVRSCIPGRMVLHAISGTQVSTRWCKRLSFTDLYCHAPAHWNIPPKWAWFWPYWLFSQDFKDVILPLALGTNRGCCWFFP